jgi:hypothetical protein
MTSISSNSTRLFDNANLNTIMGAGRSGIVGTSDDHGVRARSSFISGLANIASKFSPELQQANKDAKLNFMMALKSEFKLDESTLMKFEKMIDVESGKPLKMSQAQDIIIKAFTQTEIEKSGSSLDNLNDFQLSGGEGGVHDFVEMHEYGDQISFTSQKFAEFEKANAQSTGVEQTGTLDTDSMKSEFEEFNKAQMMRAVEQTLDDDDFEEDVQAVGPGAMRNELAKMKEGGASIQELGNEVVKWMKMKGMTPDDINANLHQTMTDMGIYDKETGGADEPSLEQVIDETGILLASDTETGSTTHVETNFDEVIFGKIGSGDTDELGSLLDEITQSSKQTESFEQVVERLLDEHYEAGQIEDKAETEKEITKDEIKHHHHHGDTEETTILQELQSNGVLTEEKDKEVPVQSQPPIDVAALQQRNQRILDLVNKQQN